MEEKALDFMAAHGFQFARIPTSYWRWTENFDYDHPVESVLEQIDQAIASCHERSLHVSLNLHRGPGYCINSNHLEKHNLWLDEIAQNAFIATWTRWAARYKGIPGSKLSFDLLNEPPNPGQYGMTREIHSDLMRRTARAIWEIDPDRPVTLDGLGGGHLAMPELADFPVTHSGRGYQPMTLSHWQAGWWKGWEGQPQPIWPGTQWDGKTWDKEELHRFYEPWREVEAQGRPIHMGEFGCFTGVDNGTALAWLSDLMSLWKSYGWGWAMWNFQGPFGFVEHGREGAVYEDVMGFQVDRAMLDILLENRLDP